MQDTPLRRTIDQEQNWKEKTDRFLSHPLAREGKIVLKGRLVRAAEEERSHSWGVKKRIKTNLFKPKQG